MKRSALRSRPPADHSDEPGYRTWHAPTWGECSVCRAPDRLVRHHVILAQHVRALGGPVWDLRNALTLGAGGRCGCHRAHHHATRRLPISALNAENLAFAVQLYGEDRAAEYLLRYYRVG